MPKISYASYSDLSLVISAPCTLEMCAATKNSKKNIKTPNFGGVESFKVIDVNTVKKLVITH